MPNTCAFWDCEETIRSDHVMCREHYQDLQDGLIDECPGCGRGKAAQYEVCYDCYHTPPAAPKKATKAGTRPAAKRQPKLEHSETWEKGDEGASEFFAYILKLDGGEFYVGHTRELRERLSEHKDGDAKSTAGLNPKLVWFTTLPTRKAATEVEAELKELNKANQRAIRRMVIGFRDLVSEIDK